MIIAALSNSVNVTDRNINADFAADAAAIALREWHEWAVEPPVFEEPEPQRPTFIVNVTAAGLSEIAKHHLRREVEYRRHNGQPVAMVAEWAREWCRGYAAQNGTGPLALLPTTAYFDGSDYARGENAYWRCMAEAEDDVVFVEQEV